MHRVSIIVPALDEAEGIARALTPLQALRARGHEVLVVDGGSADGTAEAAATLADRVLRSERGRARQQNAGAREARGDVLLFLHADTRLPEGADRQVLDGLARSGRGWGRFDVRLTGAPPMLRVVERMISLRSRVGGVATGDQAIFVRRDWFRDAGGFPEIPLMEDVALSRALLRRGRPLCLRETVLTSSRRWESRGIWRTILLMWRLRLEYRLGADPERLAARYR
jgi:rSAM/selenodomain-associated transferase 2